MKTSKWLIILKILIVLSFGFTTGSLIVFLLGLLFDFIPIVLPFTIFTIYRLFFIGLAARKVYLMLISLFLLSIIIFAVPFLKRKSFFLLKCSFFIYLGDMFHSGSLFISFLIKEDVFNPFAFGSLLPDVAIVVLFIICLKKKQSE